MNKLTPVFIAAAIAVSGGLAFAQGRIAQDASAQESSGGHGHGGHEAAAAEGASSPSTLAFQAANDRMHADMAIEYTGNADIDFLRGMIPHHQGAIDMARAELEHGSDPEVRALAEEIIKAQEAEIAMMKEWLAKRGH